MQVGQRWRALDGCVWEVISEQRGDFMVRHTEASGRRINIVIERGQPPAGWMLLH